MNIKKIEFSDPELIDAIKKRYELLRDEVELNDVDFVNSVDYLNRFIAFRLCRIYGAVVECRKFGVAK